MHKGHRITAIPYLTALRDQTVSVREIPVFAFPSIHPHVTLVVTADLQGSVFFEKDRNISPELHGLSVWEVMELARAPDFRICPLGEALPSLLEPLLSHSLTLILLAGDLCGVLQRRATCDVTSVWQAFCKLGPVVGVTGNHDLLPSPPRGTHLLDGHLLSVHGLRIGGVSGIIGRPEKNPRNKTPEEYERVLRKVLRQDPQILLLHPPPHLGSNLRGHVEITQTLEDHTTPLILFCGHQSSWPEGPVKFNKHTILNAEGRVLIFTDSHWGDSDTGNTLNGI